MMECIMIVDDDFDDLQNMKDILEEAGYQVIPTTNGAQALDMIRQNEIDLILLDIKMPTLSGYDLLLLLKERKGHDTPIIYVTIIPENDVDMAGAIGVIQKPISKNSLLSQVRKGIDNRTEAEKCQRQS